MFVGLSSLRNLWERIEQHYLLLFVRGFDDMRVHTIKKIQQAFGDITIVITQIKEWYKYFNQRQILVESKPWFSKPSTSINKKCIANVYRIVKDDRRITINEFVGEVGISAESVHAILQKIFLRNLFPNC